MLPSQKSRKTVVIEFGTKKLPENPSPLTRKSPYASLPLFAASKLKLERAEVHIREVKQIRDRYFELDPINLTVENWDEMKSFPTAAWKFKIKDELPIKIALPFGDAIHNLRSALDIAAIDAVHNEGKNVKNVRFPFAHSKDNLLKQINESNIKRAGPAILRFVKDIKPYKGGNGGLFALHSLDIADKHRMLIPTASSGTLDLSRLSSKTDQETRNKLENWNTGVIDGAMAVAMPMAWSPPVGTIIPAEYTLGFHFPDEDYGHEIVDYLSQMKQVVAEILEAIETISKGQNSYHVQPDGTFCVERHAKKSAAQTE